MKLKLNSFMTVNVLRNICNKNIKNIFFNRLTMSINDGNLNIEPKVTGVKRVLEREDDEDWVKRIQIDPKDEEDTETIYRRKLRKFVLLLSYCGKGYLGMQRNPGYKTIEDDLIGAMLHANLIKEEGATCPQIYRFQRAARTDKGVSAVRQIVSVKLPDDTDIPEAINAHLPEQIRVIRAVRVTQKFDAKTQCDSRSYSYLCPTFAFAPVELTNEDYRISEDNLQELRSIFNIYKGTHNHHNFTARVKFQDRNAQRYIMDFTCSEPFVRDGLEWTLIKVKGQSFMLHQIRKMIGLAIAISKGFLTKEVFDTVWKQPRQDVPIAPSLGLVLEEPHYGYYNKKYAKDGIHEPLLWNAEEEKIQAFREKYIDSVIVESEIKEKSMLTWLETLQYHTFDKRIDGPPGQKVPFDQDNNESTDTDMTEKENEETKKPEENGGTINDNGCSSNDSSSRQFSEEESNMKKSNLE